MTFSRAERRHHQTKREILDAALEQLRAGKPLSLRGVAADIGLTAPALYRYFPNAAALEAKVVETLLEEFHQEAQDLRATADLTDAFAHASVTRDWMEHHVGELRVLLTAPGFAVLTELLGHLEQTTGSDRELSAAAAGAAL